MDLPVRLKFFRKLELYQQLMGENSKRDGTERAVWDMEKDILKWTIEHHHLSTSIETEKIKKILEKTGKYEDLSEYSHVDSNLADRGFGKFLGQGIVINMDGLMMGDVIRDVEDGNIFKRIKYPVFYWLTWVTISSGLLLVIFNLIKVSIELYIGK